MNIIIKTIIYAILNCNLIYSSLKIQILKTPIFRIIPNLKLHHVILLIKNNNIYTLDFTPININILKLILNKNILGEIRLRHFNNISNYSLKELEYNFHKKNNINIIESKQLSDITFDNIQDKEIKKIINKYYYIDLPFNIYSNNCQHFCKMLLDEYSFCV